jgi:hypothetical protein
MGSGGFMRADTVESQSAGTTSTTTPKLEGGEGGIGMGSGG